MLKLFETISIHAKWIQSFLITKNVRSHFLGNFFSIFVATLDMSKLISTEWQWIIPYWFSPQFVPNSFYIWLWILRVCYCIPISISKRLMILGLNCTYKHMYKWAEWKLIDMWMQSKCAFLQEPMIICLKNILQHMTPAFSQVHILKLHAGQKM